MGYKLTGIYMRPNGTEQKIRPKNRTPGANTLVYYNINDNDTNSTIYDLSGNSVDQTWYGNPSYSTDATYGRVAVFDGYSNTKASGIIDFGGELTFIALFLRDNINTSMGIVTECGSSSLYAIGIANQGGDSDRTGGWFAGQGGNGNDVIQPNTPDIANQWMMVAITRDSSGTAKIYRNGVLSNTSSGMHSPGYSRGEPLSIGLWRQGYSYLQGKFKLFIGENRTWTDAEIASLAAEYGF